LAQYVIIVWRLVLLTTMLEIIPDPSVGSGSPALGVLDLFPTQDFDRVNQEATSQPNGGKNLKQTVDHVLHDLKPSKRTQ
jgi:cohesin loading factor subunit SCC2